MATNLKVRPGAQTMEPQVPTVALTGAQISALKRGEPWRRSYIKWLQRAGWCANHRLDWLSDYCARVAAGLAEDYYAEFGFEIDD